jgi:hypothetical protein
VTDRDGMYVHVTAKGAMSFRMDCQPMSWLRSTMQPSRPSRNGHPISTAFRFRSGAKDPERNTLRNAVINWPDGEEGEKSHFRDGLPLFIQYGHRSTPSEVRLGANGLWPLLSCQSSCPVEIVIGAQAFHKKDSTKNADD